jgi:hypothetical protein
LVFFPALKMPALWVKVFHDYRVVALTIAIIAAAGGASPTQVIGVPVRAASAMAAFRAVFEGVTGRRGGSLMENSISWLSLHD